jgi:hypothetical protein
VEALVARDVVADGLCRILRFSSSADPMYCVCGHTWGHHGQLGKSFGGGFTKTPLTRNVTDCHGAGNNVCPCMNFVYDYTNPANQVIKVCSYMGADC